METRPRTRSSRRVRDDRVPEGPLAATENGGRGRGPRRRLHPAGQAIIVAVGALLLGAFLNARGLHKTAQSMNPSWKRDLGLALAKPLQTVSDDTGLGFPRRGLKAIIGRSSDDDIVTAIVLPPQPPATTPQPQPPVTPPATTPQGNPQPPPAAPPPPPPPPKKPAFSPSHPLKVYIGGDSLVIVPGESLLRAMGSRVYKPIDSVDGHVATGLERPDVYNWFDRIRQVMKKDKPNVVVAAFGANDDHSYMTGLPPGVSLGDFGSAAWIREYRRRVGGFMDTVIRGGGFIVYLGMPIVQSPNESRDFDLINRILYQEAKKRPTGAVYVDTWYQFADPKTGGFAEYLKNAHGELVKVRANDGVHFEPAGGDIIARLVLKEINKRYDLTSWKKQHRG
jgi:uncharacterized protein